MAASPSSTGQGIERLGLKHSQVVRLRVGLLAPYLDALVDTMADEGYGRDSILGRVHWAHRFGGYAAAHGVTDVSWLSDALVAEFVAARRRLRSMSAGQHRGAVRHLRGLLAFLRSRALVPPRAVPLTQTPADALLAEYDAFLREHRGIVATSTFERYRRYSGDFLRSIGDRATPTRLREVGADDLRRFLTERCENLSRSERSVVCIALRGFLRFTRVRGYLSRDLVDAVPTIPSYRLDRVPPVFAREDMERTIAAIDLGTSKGLRDRALLLVLATYGMRIGQIRRLGIDDIDWRQQTIRFRAAKNGRDVVLPLTATVGEALVVWLKARPTVTHREVFLRVRSPLRPLKSNLYPLIERYARKAGVKAPIVGTRAWRHGRATEMLERGETLKTIRDMLGHRSIESTFIYTKVDLPALRQAALDWPGERA